VHQLNVLAGISAPGDLLLHRNSGKTGSCRDLLAGKDGGCLLLVTDRDLSFDHGNPRALCAVTDGEDGSFYGDQTIVSRYPEEAIPLIGRFDDDVAAGQLDRLAAECFVDRKFSPFRNLYPRPVAKPNDRI